MLRLVLVVPSLTFLAALACPVLAAESEAIAERLLEESGVEGGLIVHVGSGDGELTAALKATDAYRVHRLDPSGENVAKLRQWFREQELLGPVTVQQWTGPELPLTDGVVNLLVLEDEGDVDAAEIQRVLCPGGVVYVNGSSSKGSQDRSEIRPLPGPPPHSLRSLGREMYTKAWPAGIDEWTHFLHGPDNNAVADDEVVSYPFYTQWVGAPKWARHHNHLSSTSAMVTSAGRIFSIMDEGPNASLSQPPKWKLIARDAFNGVLLWKKKIGPWEGHLRPFRSGPTELQRRLVAVEDRVYVTLYYGAPLTALDAATGKLVKKYKGTEGAAEVLCSDGKLYVVVGETDREQVAQAARRGSPSPLPRNKRIVVLDADSGEVLWSKSDRDTWELLPATLGLAGNRLVFHAIDHVVCLDATSGDEIWRTPRKAVTKRKNWSTPTVVIRDGVVLCADCADATGNTGEKIEWKVTAGPARGEEGLGRLLAMSLEDGKILWETPTTLGYTSPPDVFVADGLVWTCTQPNLTKADFTEGRDPKTGEVKRRIDTADAFTVTHHHRCYRNKATNDFILVGRTGTEFIDLSGELHLRHCWVRGACQYGVMPANGLLYAPPHSCACYIQSKLSGFWALAPREGGPRKLPDISDEDRMEKGPAFETVLPAIGSSISDWPTYRADAARSGRASAGVSGKLDTKWQVDLAAPITSPVSADGVVLVATVDDHTVHALDAETGERRWTFTAGGRIDSPPTIEQGTVLFGSADGYVYCLTLDDGALRWRFLAAPADRRLMSFGQLESVWPVTGSVLVQDGIVYCTAGRSSYLDGGMTLWRLDAETGKPIGSMRLDSRDPETGRQPEEEMADTEMPGALPDVLASDGENLYLRDMRMDLEGNSLPHDVPHMYSSAGLLDDHWWHRTYWIYGFKTYGRASGWAVLASNVPSGRLLVLDDKTVFGFGRQKVNSLGMADGKLHLFRADKEVIIPDRGKRLKNNNVDLAANFVPSRVKYHWSKEVPLVARAIVLTENALFVAGPEMDPGKEAEEPDFGEPGPAVLTAFDPKDGEQVAEYSLDSQPVLDGMIAAGGCLFVSLVDGRVVCWGP
jgi:outer membrane protein assembly factor BamB